MRHKSIAYRRHQKERVIKARQKLMFQLNSDWPENHLFLTESNRLSKRRPFGHCQNRHCSICNYKGYRKKYLTKLQDRKLDDAAKADLDSLTDFWFLYEECITQMFPESSQDSEWKSSTNADLTPNGEWIYIDPHWGSFEAEQEFWRQVA